MTTETAPLARRAAARAATASTVRSGSRGVLVVALVLALAAVHVLFVGRPFLPSLPTPDIDGSWVTVLGEAAAKSARWGVDIIFTYGPASPLSTVYYNTQFFSHTVPIIVLVGLVDAACVVCLLTTSLRGPAGIVLGAVAYAVGLTTDTIGATDATIFSIALLVFLLDIAVDGREPLSRVVILAGAAIAGVLACSKMTYVIAGLSLFLIADARSLARRRVPLLSVTCVAAAVATFLFYGQRLGDLPTFVRAQGELIAGYSEAMGSVGSRWELMAFVALAAGLLLAVAANELSSPAPRRAPMAVSGATAVFLLLVFKAGFVRQDLHTQIGWGSLGLAGLFLGIARVAPRSRAAGLGVCGAALSVLVVVMPFYRTEGAPSWTAYRDAVESAYKTVPLQVANIAAFLQAPSAYAETLAAQKESAWANVRGAVPLPALEGSVDVIPSIQSAVIASGLDYRPRPSFQEYATYTAGLVAANKAFFAGDRAPDWVVFSPDTIDNRLPASAEGPLWPDFWRRYEPTRRFGTSIMLHKRDVALGEVLGEPRRLSARLGEPLRLPADGPVFARIDVRPTLLGRLVAVLFRPPFLGITLRLRNGETLFYHLIAEQAREGFLLSPAVDDADGFAAVAFGEAGDLADRDVLDVTVDASPSNRGLFDPAIAVELRPVTLANVSPSPLAASLHADIAGRRAWRRTVNDLHLSKDFLAGRLSAQPPKSLTIPVGGGDGTDLRFGIDDGAWTTGHTQGVCFAAADARTRGTVLWRRCLDPAEVEADRGEQTAHVDLPEGAHDLVLATTCPKDCSWGWAYWSGVSAAR